MLLSALESSRAAVWAEAAGAMVTAATAATVPVANTTVTAVAAAAVFIRVAGVSDRFMVVTLGHGGTYGG
ncbi:hypothetical protein GCM10009631_21570 [Corynebacterium glaucum]